jgi:hypothetical protein
MPTQNRIALPVLVAHSAVIQVPAVVMSIVGSLLIYGTITSFDVGWMMMLRRA